MKNLFCSFLIIGCLLSTGVFAQPELDTTFNSSGKVLVNIAGNSGAWNMVVQPDNKVIMVSGCSNSSGSFPVCSVRLNEDGSVDTTYGNFGQLQNPPGAVLTRYTEIPTNGQATGIALQSDGKIIAAGPVVNGGKLTGLIRYNSDGSLDTTFGTGGKVFANLTGAQTWFEDVRAVVIQPDGKIVIAGDSEYIIPPPIMINIRNQFVARYLPNGTLDSTFGQGGIIKLPQSGTDSSSGQSLAIQPDGKILLGGNVWNNISSPSGPPFAAYYLTRLNSNGSIDGSWNTVKINYSGGGIATDGLRAIALQPDGRVVALGHATRRLFRFMSNGSPDASFDFDGARPVFQVDENPFDLVISADGRITVVGMSYQGGSWITNYPYLVERFMPDGSYDGTFGAGGRLDFHFSQTTLDGARAVSLDPAGRVVIAGIAADATDPQFPWQHTIFSAARLTAPAITPAPSNITGRVMTAEGLPVSGVTMKLSDGSGTTMLARTNPFGYYQFAGVMSGRLYSVSVKSRAIAVSERSLFLAGDVLNFDFTGAPRSSSKGNLKEDLVRFK